MELAQEVMSGGSYQVEMSDEGLMTEDIEECLQVVIKAVAKSDLPAAEVAAWCADMTKRDRIWRSLRLRIGCFGQEGRALIQRLRDDRDALWQNKRES